MLNNTDLQGNTIQKSMREHITSVTILKSMKDDTAGVAKDVGKE